MKKEIVSQNETKQVSLEILKVVTDVCEQNNLRYFLMYGTLIGAIRHKGFIPWDDDIDIMMPRDDYLILIDLLESDSFLNCYPNLKFFNHDNCKNYPYMIGRVSNQNYEIVMKNEKNYGMGIFIDIYPFDGVGDTLKESLKIARRGNILSSFCYQSTRNHYARETTKKGIKSIFKIPFFYVSKCFGKNFFQNKLKRLEGIYKFDKKKYVCCLVWTSGGYKDIFERKLFDNYKYTKFEKYSFRIPEKYDTILKYTYGDYMKLPPKKERTGHHDYYVIRRK